MSSLFSRDFPPLPSQSSSAPDFSKLTLGVDYVVSYTSTGQQTHVLTKDLQQVAAQLSSRNSDGTFSPPSTRSGTRYSLTTYPIRRKNESNRGGRGPIRGGRGGQYGGNNCGGFQRQNHGSSQYSPASRPSYSNVVASPPRSNFSTPNLSSPPPPTPSITYPNQQIWVIPNLDVDQLTLNSMYNEMKQCLTNVHGELHAQKTATGNQINRLNSVLSDDGNGIDALALRLSDVETDISHSSGIKNTLKGIQEDLNKLKSGKNEVELRGEDVDFLQNKLDGMCCSMDLHGYRLETITGILTHQQQQIDSLKLANAGNVANNIIDNVVIGGILATEHEDCHQKAAHFFIDRMDLHPCQDDILTVERMGKGVTKGNMEFPPLMKVRCSPYFRSLVWEHRQCLKGQRDPIYKWKFFVDLQCPDVFKVANNRYKTAMDKVLANNEGKEDKFKSVPKVTGNKFIIDGEMQRDPIYVPTPQDLICLSLSDREELDAITFEESAPYTLSDSTFKAFCTDISSYDAASLAYKKIKLEHIYASHIMMACVFKNGDNLEVFSCDDGEDSGGLTLQKMMLDSQFYGHALFVIRWKLGGNMGARRFRCIEAVAQKIMEKVKMKKELRPRNPMPSDRVPPVADPDATKAKTPASSLQDNPTPSTDQQVGETDNQ